MSRIAAMLRNPRAVLALVLGFTMLGLAIYGQVVSGAPSW